jgi:hypothetical protein
MSINYFLFFIRLRYLTFVCSCALSHRAKLCTRQVISALSIRSTFPKSGQGTKPLLYQEWSLTYMFCCTKQLKTTFLFHLSNYIPHTILQSFLFILLHLQKGLIMGKPMGQHPITHYKTLRTPCWVHKAHKTSEIHDISSTWVLHH